MSELQEVLAVLLGAESEASRIVEDAKVQAAGVMSMTHESFEPNRKAKMSAAREQAKSVMENAMAAADAETTKIRKQGDEERRMTQKRFDENVDAVVAAVLAETVDKILTGGA